MDSVKTIFENYNNSCKPINDSYFDSLLGIKVKPDKLNDFHQYQNKYGVEQFIYEGTPYNYIRLILHQLKLKNDEIIYDLGSGYGRFVFYGALTNKAFFKGIEIVSDRVKKCETIAEQLNLKNTKFINDNVLNIDFSDGNYFFLFNPFYRETLIPIANKLKEIAQQKQIHIISWGGSSDEYFSSLDWLLKFNTLGKIKFFRPK